MLNDSELHLQNSTWHSWVSRSSQLLSTILCPVGILSSVLSICSFWRQAFGAKNIFFVTMLIISVFDLIYNVLYLVNKWVPDVASSEIIVAPLYSVSLVSDLCALYLTVERFVALRCATKLRSANEKTKRRLRITVACLIGFIGSWRLHYVLPGMVKLELIRGDLAQTALNISLGWTILTDMFLPFVLIILMLVFSGLIIFTVWRRKEMRAKVKPFQFGCADSPQHADRSDPADQQADCSKSRAQQEEDRIQSLTSLILVLDLFFILNQLAYCALTVAHIRRSLCDGCPGGVRIYGIFEFVGDFVECLHHSLNFYFYVSLSSSVRGEFVRFLNGLKGRLVSSQ